MPILYKWKERTKVVLQKLIVCFFLFFPFVMSKMIHTNFQEQYTTTTYVVLVYKKCLLLAHLVLRKFRMSLWQAWHMDVALWEEGDQLVLILALIFRNGWGVGHKPPQMGRWEAQRQSCDARGWHTLCKGGRRVPWCSKIGSLFVCLPRTQILLLNQQLWILDTQ